eukprot:Skav232874  [mRNA]  locus=scaffold1432:8789:11416:- [translate_table: standard]
MVLLTHDPGSSNGRCSVVVFPVALDPDQKLHLVVDSISKQFFRVEGYLREGAMSYTLLNAQIHSDVDYSKLVVDGDTFLLTHATCDWNSIFSAIEMCSGSGYMGIGARVSGFKTLLGCDYNEKFTAHYAKLQSIPTVTGNICDHHIISEIWSKIPFPCGILAGVSCQPYSTLGDKGSGDDQRSASLPGVLQAIHWLRAPWGLLECVEPAQQDVYVQDQISSFCEQTGYKAHQVILKLQDVWPARRGRWWCLLLSPALGSINPSTFPLHAGITKISQIITRPTKLEPDELTQLILHDDENQAFGVDQAGQSPHMLNVNGLMPCALHSWGNPLQACPCTCRGQGLSRHRLQEKGLHGVVMPTDTPPIVRHIHPAELAVLSGVDPVQDWEPLRFSLCSLGQLASPLQSLWMLTQLKAHLDRMHHGSTEASPFKDLLTYMGWLIARSKMLWDPKITGELGLIASVWEPVTTLSLDQLYDLNFWDHRGCDGLPLSKIFHMIQHAEQDSPLAEFLRRELAVLKEADAVQTEEIPPTVPFTSEDTQGVWVELDQATTFVMFAPNATISDLLAAECRLSDGKCKMVCKDQGCELSPDSLLQPGQNIQICFLPPPEAPEVDMEGESGQLPNLMPCHDEHAEHHEDHDMNEAPADDSPAAGAVAMPEAAHDNSEAVDEAGLEHEAPSMTEAPPATVDPHVSGVTLVGPTPLVLLDRDGLLRLEAPMHTQHANIAGLLSQTIRSVDRARILDAQDIAWGDDEIRWHLNRLFDQHVSRLQSATSQDAPYFQRVIMVDPLLIHGWIATGGVTISQWCQQYEVTSADAFVLVAPLKGHWAPFVAWFKHGNMNVKTWDEQQADHSAMLPVLMSLASALGVTAPPVFLPRA